ncbi:Uricase [Mycena indigotica]|uniref:Uricase n=1 Tax=Mycena indigotica TaxID=2126181 RepID=A0A8H6WBF6_9AGAR|nr:Uricase [Mycena indigotica]KAF7310186.1 Uricase [Mycena indigotica]
MSDDSFVLSAARYGKDKVRVLRIVREGAWHHVVEYNVQVLLEGAIETSYTQADNSVVVATDSMKNITYYIAKISPHILVPEHFALHLGTHIVSRYAHIAKAFVTVEQLRWSRISIDGKDHPHAFIRDGDDKRVVRAEVDATAGKDKITGNLSAGLADLLVLKSTESAFTNFVRDRYTTLAEVDDRILSTAIDLEYTFIPFPIAAPADAQKEEFILPPTITPGSAFDIGVPARARTSTLHIFATHNSASVQATLHRMASAVLKENPGVHSVRYALPNKHYIPVDMRYIGVENVKPSEAEVFMPIAAPSGLITATVSRK